MKIFSLAATGGTFDRLHKGHEELLKTAFSLSKKVIIGITAGEMVREKKLSHLILPLLRRTKELTDFLKKNRFYSRSEIVVLHDPYGPLLKNAKIEAVVVGPRADKKVLEKLKNKVRIVRCKIIRSNDRRYLSSTRIRKGEVSRSGFLYLYREGPFILPSSFRERLKEPLGKVVSTPALNVKDSKKITVVVGDVSVRTFNKLKRDIDLSIVDFRIQRKKTIKSFSDLGFSISDFKKTYRLSEVVSLPGNISSELVKEVKASFERLLKGNKKEIIKIDGEDDLAVIPVILYSPLETVVYYGQPDNGLVEVIVTEEKKKEIRKILDSFTDR